MDLNNVSLIIASKYRKLIMESLLDGNKTIKEISDECNVSKRLLYAPAKSLRDHGLVRKNKHVYMITEEGLAVINKVHEIRGR